MEDIPSFAPIVQRLGFTPSKGEARVRFPVGAKVWGTVNRKRSMQRHWQPSFLLRKIWVRFPLLYYIRIGLGGYNGRLSPD